MPTTRPKVLITNAIHPQAHARLAAAADITVLKSGSQDELMAEIGDADALLVRMPIKGEAIRAGTRLKVVARHGVGLDYIPVDVCTELGIPVIYTPDANTESVAEHVLGSMIALSHEMARADRAVRTGRWNVRDTLMGMDIRNRCLGIVGLGRIGRRVADICRTAFSMQVLAFDPQCDRAAAQQCGVELLSLEVLLPRADFLTLHAPMTPQTRHLIDARAIALMKRGAFLINHARGGLVDTAALTEALRSGHLRGAAVDVLEEEPPASDLPLLALENVIVTPHTAAVTEEAMLRMGSDAGDDIIRVLSGVRPNACANPTVLER